MTLTPQAEARIDERIRALAPRRGAVAARQELRSHVADAAEALAYGKPALVEHVDAAFAALGSDADIRATFFPAPGRVPVGRVQVGLLALATVLAATAILAQEGGRASCSVQGEGSCEANSSGDALELAVWATPPLLVLAALFIGPAWMGAAVAVIYFVVTALRTIDTATIAGDAGWQLLLPVGALLACAVAGQAVVRERQLGRGTNA